MSKILLDYAFPISVITPTAAASTAFLKQVLVLAKPKTGQEGNVGEVYECTTAANVVARTDNTNAQQLFSAGMTKVYLMLANDLDLAVYLASNAGLAFTLLVTDDFDKDDLGSYASGEIEITAFADLLLTTEDEFEIAGVVFTAQAGAVTEGEGTFQAATDNAATAASLVAQINAHETAGALVTATLAGAVITITSKALGTIGNTYSLTYTDNGSEAGATVTGSGTIFGAIDAADFGAFDGVIGFSTSDAAYAATFAAADNRVGFYNAIANGSKNMFYAFGKLLSNLLNWTNQQYISMPFSDDVGALGTANSYFDSKMSFVISDDEFGNRLALFAAGSKAIVAPYILKNLRVDLQGNSLTWISGNQPQYTIKEAALLQNRLQEDVVNSYITRSWITGGTIDIRLEQANFVASGYINVSEPNALWRIVGEMRQTL